MRSKCGRVLIVFLLSACVTAFFPNAPARGGCDELERIKEMIGEWEQRRTNPRDDLDSLKEIVQGLEKCIARYDADRVNFTGRWYTPFGVMELRQNGSQVTGTYEQNHGEIKGEVTGNVLVGKYYEAPTYKEPQDGGDIELVLAVDGKTFTGRCREGSYGDWIDEPSGKRE